MDYIKVYDLKNDTKTVNMIQEATLNSEDAGLKMDHGLFGSQEWWDAIEKKRLPKNVIEGKISKVYMSGHNDYPEFEIESQDGKTKWTRDGDEQFYKVGKRVRLTYVLEKFKKPIKPLGEFSEIVLAIEIEK